MSTRLCRLPAWLPSLLTAAALWPPALLPQQEPRSESQLPLGIWRAPPPPLGLAVPLGHGGQEEASGPESCLGPHRRTVGGKKDRSLFLFTDLIVCTTLAEVGLPAAQLRRLWWPRVLEAIVLPWAHSPALAQSTAVAPHRYTAVSVIDTASKVQAAVEAAPGRCGHHQRWGCFLRVRGLPLRSPTRGFEPWLGWLAVHLLFCFRALLCHPVPGCWHEIQFVSHRARPATFGLGRGLPPGLAGYWGCRAARTQTRP